MGENLTELSVRRWFVSESFDGGAMEMEIGIIREIVRTSNLDGFARVVKSLYDMDLRGEMAKSELKAVFVVGSEDGVLPGTMEEMAKGFGKGAQYALIDGAGHFPMVEKPHEFSTIVSTFVERHSAL